MAVQQLSRTRRSRRSYDDPAAPAVRTGADEALDEALARVRELSLRLWDVRAEHRLRRRLLGAPRCSTCGSAYPCSTLLAVAPRSA